VSLLGLRNIAPDKAAYSYSKDLPWFGPLQFVAMVGTGDGQAVCCGAFAEADSVRGPGIIDPRHGEQMRTVLAIKQYQGLQF